MPREHLAASSPNEAFSAIGLALGGGLLFGAHKAAVESWWVSGRFTTNMAPAMRYYGALWPLFYGVAIAAAKIRNQDDMFNFGLAGAVTGICSGLMTKSTSFLIVEENIPKPMLNALLFGLTATLVASSFHESTALFVGKTKDKQVFKYPQADPFLNRLEEIKNRTQ